MSGAGLTARQVVFTNKAFWRNPASAFFTFAFPLMFLSDLHVAPGQRDHRGRPLACSSSNPPTTSPTWRRSSVITACYTNIAISV